MRCLERNKQVFTYATYLGKTPIVDADGYQTGEYGISYDDAKTMRAYVTSQTGEAVAEVFGTDVKYDRVIVTDDTACPINEHSVLCIEKTPIIESGKLTNWDYVVTKVAKSLNFVSIAVSKVEVN